MHKADTQPLAIAEKLLGELGFEQDVSNRIQYLIAHHHTYDNINEIDYQILVEADFLVNVMEDGLSKEAALKAYHSSFSAIAGPSFSCDSGRLMGTSKYFIKMPCRRFFWRTVCSKPGGCSEYQCGSRLRISF